MTDVQDARRVDPNGVSNPAADMRLARAFVVQIATPRLETDQSCLPYGFVSIWGGAAAVRIIALDRDRLGCEVDPLDLAAILVHPGPGPAPGWRTGPTP